MNHTAVTCRFNTAKCHKCGKTGHLKAVCRSRGASTAPRENRQRAERTDIRLVEETERATEEYTLNQLHTAGRSPQMVDVEVEGYTLPMEVDTGASLSLVSEATFKRCWPSKRSFQPGSNSGYTRVSRSLYGGNASACKEWAAHFGAFPLSCKGEWPKPLRPGLARASETRLDADPPCASYLP